MCGGGVAGLAGKELRTCRVVSCTVAVTEPVARSGAPVVVAPTSGVAMIGVVVCTGVPVAVAGPFGVTVADRVARVVGVTDGPSALTRREPGTLTIGWLSDRRATTVRTVRPSKNCEAGAVLMKGLL
jgi:hypothetical protein